MPEDSINALSISIFELNILEAIGLNSFDKLPIEMFFVDFGLFVKMICFFDKYFIRHIDGKYRSATALLVYIFHCDYEFFSTFVCY